MGRAKRGRPRRAAGLKALAGLFLLAALLFLWERWQYGGMKSGFSEGGLPSSAQTVETGLQVYFLDVGQGDSELVRIPWENGYFTMLIDTGEYEYADGLTDCLRSLGVDRIDALVCSHPHTDHMGCMARIVQRFQIGTLYMPKVPDDLAPTTAAYEALLNAALKRGMTITDLREGTQIDAPETAAFTVMAPRANADWDDLNNWSAVIRLEYGAVSFLFTGDAESASEKLILEDAEEHGWQLESSVLKCGHHGSKTSSSAKFLKAVAPEYAVISCGKGNDYGHPHKTTKEKLSKLGVKVYRTDQDGTVLAESDGETVVFQTGLPSVETRG